MFLKEKKGNLWKWVVGFFAAMVIFTLASRAIYQQGTAVVSVASPSRGVVPHSLRIPGKTQQNQEVAVTTEAGLRVGKVLVSEGEPVEEGQPLFVLDMDYLEEEIARQQQEIQKQKLTVQDGWSQNAQAQQQRSNQKAQAEENYNSAVSQAQVNVDRAERNLDRAEEALDNFLNGIDQEAILRQALQEAQAQRDEAAAALENLKMEMEQAIADAIAQAEAQQPTDPPPESTESTEESSEPLPEPPQPRGLTQAEKDQIAAQIREQYAPALGEKEDALSQGELALEEAKKALTAFQAGQGQGVTEEQLRLAAEEALEAYEDALAALETAESTYGRAMEAADLPASTSSAPQIGQITLEQMEAKLEKLLALQAQGGEILSPTEGVVTECAVRTGQKTSDTTAVLLADLSQGCKFVAQVTKEESKFIGVGDKVSLRSNDGKLYDDLPVTTFSPIEGSEDSRLAVQVPPNTLPLGAAAELRYTQKSQSYNCCIPLSALHVDERNQTYVLVVQEQNSVMGKQLAARRVDVTVQERNDSIAALADGALGSQDQVIVGWDRAIDAGSRVRVG